MKEMVQTSILHVMKKEPLNYLIKLIPKSKQRLQKRLFQVLFFPSTLNDWLNLDDNITNSESIFKKIKK